MYIEYKHEVKLVDCLTFSCSGLIGSWNRSPKERGYGNQGSFLKELHVRKNTLLSLFFCSSQTEAPSRTGDYMVIPLIDSFL